MQQLSCEELPLKLVPFIQANKDKTFALNFPHGLGDVIMWYPFYEKIKDACKGTRIDLRLKPTNSGLGLDSFDTSFDYDYLITVKFWAPGSQHGLALTKNQLCSTLEIGIPAPDELYTTKIPQYSSPLVTLGFTSNCEPERYGCPKNIAEAIYTGVIEAGYVPMVLQFKTSPDVIEPRDYSSFAHNTTKGCALGMRNLIGLIQRSSAFIGVTSGPMWVALGCLGPDRCMCLDCRREESCKVVPLEKMRFVYQGDITKEYIVKWLQNLPTTPQI